ncbi:hypothetical protein NBRC3255_0090 [Gluconobacter thailandicus NBRC 3255]|nr:hypothetical protein NBRC3255_0090 [Gluconobacter thailandicus NBRC 3255]
MSMLEAISSPLARFLDSQGAKIMNEALYRVSEALHWHSHPAWLPLSANVIPG